MATNKLPWFRMYYESVHDIKFQIAARETGYSKIEIMGAWVIILCVAAESPVRGKLYVTFLKRYSVTDVTMLLGTDVTKAQKIIDSFIELDMLSVDEGGALAVCNWDNRQYTSDNSTARVQKHRAKKRPCNVSVTPPDTESDTDTEEPSPDFPEILLPVHAADIFSAITGMVSIPNSKERTPAHTLENLYDLRRNHEDRPAMVEDGKRYFKAWTDRKYNRTNTAWIDWWIAGEIPNQRGGAAPSVAAETY